METNRIEKRRKTLLEKALKSLGNFEIGDYSIQISKDKAKYKIIDDDGNSFGFYSFNSENPTDENNYRLFMEKKNSNIKYSYNIKDKLKDQVQLLSASYYIENGAKIKLDLSDQELAIMMVSEKEKEYVVFLSKEVEEQLLNNLDKIGDKLGTYSFLNMERILTTLNQYPEIYTCFVRTKNGIKAKINFCNGIIIEYQIIDLIRNKEIVENFETLPIIELTEKNPIIDAIQNVHEPQRTQLNKLLRWL